MIRRFAVLLLASVTAAPATAQVPLQPYDASGRYRTGALEGQLTGSLDGGRDVLLSWGRLAAGGRAGRWMLRTEVAAGVQVGQSLAERVLAGPQLSVALAEPGWYTDLDGTRAEPYLLAGGGAYGVVGFGEAEDELGISPNLFVGIGFRLFDDEWDVGLTHVELVLQQRFGMAEQAPQIYLRFSRSAPPPRPGPAASPHPDGPGSLPSPPRR